MWKRESVALVEEAQVPAETEANSLEPVPTGATPIRQYKVTAVSFWGRQFKIKELPSRNVIHTLTMPGPVPGWGMCVTTGGPDNPHHDISAVAKVSLWRTVTELALGNPTLVPDTSQRVELKADSIWKHNSYAVSLPLPSTNNEDENAVVELQWKGTNKAKGFMKKLDRGMHHKLVLKENNKLLARYEHNPWSMDIAGTIDIFADVHGMEARSWELFVIMSALAVAEKTLKTVKMAMHHVDDDPSALLEGMTNTGDPTDAVLDPVGSVATAIGPMVDQEQSAVVNATTSGLVFGQGNMNSMQI